MPVVLHAPGGRDTVLEATQCADSCVRLTTTRPSAGPTWKHTALLSRSACLRIKANESPERALASGLGRAALIIPQNFERDARRGAGPTVQLMIDATDSNCGDGAGQYGCKRSTQASIRAASVWLAAPKQTVRLQQRLWFNPGLVEPHLFRHRRAGHDADHFPCIARCARDGEGIRDGDRSSRRTLPALRGPNGSLGKALVYVRSDSWNFAVLRAGHDLCFSYHIPTDPTVLLVATILYLMAGVFFGMMLGNATGTQSAAIQGVQMGSFLLSLLLSGYLFAIANIPVQIRWFSYLLPATFYVQIVRNSILRNVGWETSLRPVLALTVLAFASTP